LEARGITTYAKKLLKQKYMDLQVRDRITGQVFYAASQVVVTGQTWQVSPKQLVMGTFTWEGMGWTNDGEG
jgi:maltose-binding protein MalE